MQHARTVDVPQLAAVQASQTHEKNTHVSVSPVEAALKPVPKFYTQPVPMALAAARSRHWHVKSKHVSVPPVETVEKPILKIEPQVRKILAWQICGGRSHSTVFPPVLDDYLEYCVQERNADFDFISQDFLQEASHSIDLEDPRLSARAQDFCSAQALRSRWKLLTGEDQAEELKSSAAVLLPSQVIHLDASKGSSLTEPLPGSSRSQQSVDRGHMSNHVLIKTSLSKVPWYWYDPLLAIWVQSDVSFVCLAVALPSLTTPLSPARWGQRRPRWLAKAPNQRVRADDPEPFSFLTARAVTCYYGGIFCAMAVRFWVLRRLCLSR